jgi:glutamyl-tRNA reductase
MTTFTTEDRIKAIQTEDKADREQMLRDQNHILNQEIYDLKVKLKNANDKADRWQKAYDEAMDYAKKTLGGGK